MTAMLFTLPKQRLFDVNANPLNGGKIYIYDTNTTTPKTTYTDRARTVPHAHPIVADADGYVAPVYPPDGTYKITVKDSADVTQWTADDQQGPLDLASIAFTTSLTEPVSYKSATYVATATDWGKIFACDASGGSYELTVPSAIAKAGQQITVANTGATNRITVRQFGAELLDGGTSLALYPGERVRFVSDGSQLLRLGDLPVFRSAERQTVLSGPGDGASGSALFPATSGTLSISTQNVSTANLLVVSAAVFVDYKGTADRRGVSTVNLTWSSLTPSATCYLYVDVDTLGVMTTGHTTLAPIYNLGFAPSNTTGQFSYSILDGLATVGTGSSYTFVTRVFVGEAVTTGAAVGSCIGYSYRGRRIQTSTVFAPANRMPTSHNIGVHPVYQAEFWLRNLTAEAGYTAGQYARAQGQGNAGYAGGTPMALEDRNTASMNASTNWMVFHRTTGALTAITPANWQAVFYMARGW
jgi:hypothetical protein